MHDLMRYGTLTLLAIAIIYFAFGGKAINYDEAALGTENTSLFGKVNNQLVHCSTVTNSVDCIAPATERSLDHRVLWLGNSQLHVINQVQPGDLTAPVIAARALREHAIDLITFSQPNASFQEHLLMFEYLLSRLEPNTLVLPLVFDDMREDNIRPSVSLALEDQAVADKLLTTSLAAKVSKMNQQSESLISNKDKTLQARSEAWLEKKLTIYLPGWHERGEAKSWIGLSLYKLRNWIFQIDPTSKRRKIIPIYQRNLDALKDIYQQAQLGGVKVISYIVPIRNDVNIPYDLEEYSKFKKLMEKLASKNNAVFLNLEDIVVARFWGTKDSTSVSGAQEIDFMHFQADGHKVLAEYIIGQLEPAKP